MTFNRILQSLIVIGAVLLSVSLVVSYRMMESVTLQIATDETTEFLDMLKLPSWLFLGGCLSLCIGLLASLTRVRSVPISARLGLIGAGFIYIAASVALAIAYVTMIATFMKLAMSEAIDSRTFNSDLAFAYGPLITGGILIVVAAIIQFGAECLCESRKSVKAFPPKILRICLAFGGILALVVSGARTAYSVHSYCDLLSSGQPPKPPLLGAHLSGVHLSGILIAIGIALVGFTTIAGAFDRGGNDASDALSDQTT